VVSDIIPDDLPIIEFPTSADWGTWLEEHHSDSPGLWIKMAKKASGIPSVAHAEAIDVALCFGWIDGQRRSYDGDWFLQRFTPRRAKSRWSQINREKVAKLTELGLMRPAGQLEVDRARADGRWEAAYPSSKNMQVPDDLRVVLEAAEGAAAVFAGLNASDRFAILYRLHHIEEPGARTRAISRALTALLGDDPT
jgi:uncharacterized protein YdeI (YjbR/CyaY-like superfamily)